MDLRPSEINYTQDNIKDSFRNNISLEQTFRELLSDVTEPADMPRIQVMEKDGKYWAVDGNRRLFLYRKLAAEARKIVTITVDEVPYKEETFNEKCTTKNGGRKVYVRGCGSQQMHRKLNVLVKYWRQGTLYKPRSRAIFHLSDESNSDDDESVSDEC